MLFNAEGGVGTKGARLKPPKWAWCCAGAVTVTQVELPTSRLAVPIFETGRLRKRRRVQSRGAGASPHSSEAVMQGLSSKQEKELIRLQTDTHEGSLGLENMRRIASSVLIAGEPPHSSHPSKS